MNEDEIREQRAKRFDKTLDDVWDFRSKFLAYTFTVPEAIAPKASLRLLDKGAATSSANFPPCLLSINDQASPCAQIAGNLVHRTYRSSHE